MSSSNARRSTCTLESSCTRRRSSRAAWRGDSKRLTRKDRQRRQLPDGFSAVASSGLALEASIALSRHQGNLAPVELEDRGLAALGAPAILLGECVEQGLAGEVIAHQTLLTTPRQQGVDAGAGALLAEQFCRTTADRGGNRYRLFALLRP